jgi:hypothetical protein
MLGHRDGKVVVACKDFLDDGDTLVEFLKIKNTYNAMTYDNGTSGSGTSLSEIITVMNTNSVLADIDGVTERFWDMFIIDAFIGNHDRNNTNWGIIMRGREIRGLAPVYDNGGAFFDKRDEATFAKRLGDRESLTTDAIQSSISAYIDDKEHHINPLKFIANGSVGECNDALLRFLAKCDIDKVTGVISEIPETCDGFSIISKSQSEFYAEMLKIRYEYLSDSGHTMARNREHADYAPVKRPGVTADRGRGDGDIER